MENTPVNPVMQKQRVNSKINGFGNVKEVIGIKIALCDDYHPFLESMKDRIHSFLRQNDISPVICTFCSGEALLSVNKQFDLILLDTIIEKMNGIDLAEILRRKNKNTKIIFVTNHLQYALRGYEVRALRYIMKEEIDDKLEEALLAFLGFYDHLRKKITLTMGNDTDTLRVDKIEYIESDAHRVHFHFDNGEDVRTVYKTLDEIEELLPSDEFLRIHKSYLVNLRHIRSIFNYTTILTSGDTLPVAQKRYPGVKKEYTLYRGRV